MKLWILRPIKNKHYADYWGYDSAHGFVIRTSTEKKARVLASLKPGDEGEDAWLDSTKTTCKELFKAGEEGIVMRDFMQAG